MNQATARAQRPGTRTDVVLTGFAAALRAAGLPVTPDRTQTFLQACARLGADQRVGVYWAARACLCPDPELVPVLDDVFSSWFTGQLPRRGRSRGALPPRPLPGLPDLGGSGRREQDQPDDAQVVRARASTQDLLRHRDLADLTPAERALLAELFARLHPRAPRRRSARLAAARRGRVDARATLREELRRGGEPGRLHHRRRATRPRGVVLLLDVSGSMTPYADALLRLGHVWMRSAPAGTEVFTIGTRLTRVSPALAVRDADTALRLAGQAVPDWSGGTRLGEVLQAFCDRWAHRGVARGAVVVVVSDGWERGDPGLLAEQMARLSRLAHRVVWVNPHRGKSGYTPVQSGIVAALPYVDDFLAGHSMATLEELTEVVARA